MISERGATVDFDPGDRLVRELTADDLPELTVFRDEGGCPPNAVGAIGIGFSGRGNVGLRPVGVFEDKRLVCLAMPVADRIRDLTRYDIGGVYSQRSPGEEELWSLAWKYAINMCAAEGATLGNAGAREGDGPTGAEFSVKMGLFTVAEERNYEKA